MLNVVCIQTGNYLGRGAEYVRKLRAQVKRHLTLPHRFFVVTDDASSLYPGMTCKPAALPGWWEKIRLFKPGMFEGRVLFLDLDTYLVGNIDDIASYGGQFATLQDFWRPQGLGPAVMLWEPGDFTASIWQEFEAQGKPMSHPQGDQFWLENLDQGKFAKRIDILQRLYPGAFVSYKTHAVEAVPEGAKVVCFHGKPRPHEATGWAEGVWNGNVR